MKCYTEMEGKEWLYTRGIQYESNEFVNVSNMDSFGIELPKNSFQKQEIARQVFQLVGKWNEVAVWVFDWPFYRNEEMAVIKEIRKSNFETRELIEARVHVFSKEEMELALGIVGLFLFFEWDFKIIPYPFNSAVLSLSHHNWMEFYFIDTQIGNKIIDRFTQIKINIQE